MKPHTGDHTLVYMQSEYIDNVDIKRVIYWQKELFSRCNINQSLSRIEHFIARPVHYPPVLYMVHTQVTVKGITQSITER